MKTVLTLFTALWATACAAHCPSQIDKNPDTSPVTFDLPEWEGISAVRSGLWHDPTTWDCNCVPSATDNVHIANDHWVELTADAVAGHLRIDGTGGLGLPWDAPHTLTIHGDLFCLGFIDPGISTLRFELTAHRSLTGWVDAYRIEVSGQYRLNTTGTINISKELLIEGATVQSNRALHFFTETPGYVGVRTAGSGVIKGEAIGHGLLNMPIPDWNPELASPEDAPLSHLRH